MGNKPSKGRTEVRRGQMVASCLNLSEMPATGLSEVAFMGRSNAGKSSLINALVGSKVAHTGATPGRTQRIHFFSMPAWYIVDLPGFGYAKASKSDRQKFGEAVEDYLTQRQSLISAILIQDARRDAEPEEMMVVQWADSRNILLTVVASKMDRLNRAEQAQRQQALDEQYGRSVFLVSNRTGEGLDRVRHVIRGLGLTL